MKTFKEFLLEATNPQTVINLAIESRNEIGIECAKFGDCADVSHNLLKKLNQNNIKAVIDGGYFIYNLKNDESYEHSWIKIDNYILDATIDQFYSDLDEDLETKYYGIYFSHPQVDGNWLEKRYKGKGYWMK